MQYILREKRARLKLKIPQSDYHLVSKALKHGNVYSTEYNENDVIIDVDIPVGYSYSFTKYKYE